MIQQQILWWPEIYDPKDVKCKIEREKGQRERKKERERERDNNVCVT
jgi:hypothetical protein